MDGLRLALFASTLLWCPSTLAQPHGDDGAYGRLEGDLSLSLEAGPAASVAGDDDGDTSASLMVRAGVLYLHSVGIVGQYNEGFERDAQLLERSAMGALQLRPFFLGRWAKDMEHGPPHADLLLDSLSLDLGMYRSWNNERFCAAGQSASDAEARALCRDFGMELGLGIEMSLLPRANSPFIALRAAMRWSMVERSAAFASPEPSGVFALTLGYHHLLELHLVDAGDRLE